MIILAIESSCDETAVCLLKNSKVLSHVVASSAEFHKEYGGVVPEIASRQHVATILPCLQSAIKKAKIKLSQVDMIVATGGPGLMGSLLVGVSCAKMLSVALGKPLFFVDHVVAHAFSGYVDLKGSKFPFMALVVSGGHTLLIHWKSEKNWRIVGQTTDDACGEAFDKVAKMLELGYPGGPELERMAKDVKNSEYIFPRPRLNEDNFNFSYSGLKTAVYYKIKELKERYKKVPLNQKKRIAWSFQEAACDVLVQKSIRACVQYQCGSLVIGGGVSANKHLRKVLAKSAKEKGIRVIFPEAKVCRDNAIMIGQLGYESSRKQLAKIKKNSFLIKSLKFKAYSEFTK